jgi:S-adenosylmethionine decarboxylase
LQKIKLYGFNNLTKDLSFCIYDICYVGTKDDRDNYISYIDEQYSSYRLEEILRKTCSIIGASILNIASQDYEPQGASVTILMSEEMSSSLGGIPVVPGTLPCSLVSHLDKSHICVHTYPEQYPQEGLCTFRADIDISTCGVISPLKSLGYLIKQLKSDIITIDYRIRGFTRDIDGIKHFLDHRLTSIQDFIPKDLAAMYHTSDVNIYEENIFRTRMLRKEFNLSDYLFESKYPGVYSEKQEYITRLLKKEMNEIYNGKNS